MSSGRSNSPIGRCRMLRPSKLPAIGDAVPAAERVGVVARARRASSSGVHDVEPALLVVARRCGGVGVLGRVEAAVGVAHVAEQVARSVCGHDLEVARLAGELPGVEVRADEQRVVVEHLLEVGDQPLPVDRVAGEAAADVVVDAAGGHGVEASGPRRRARRSTRCGGAGAAGSRSTSTAGTSVPGRSRPTAGRARRAGRPRPRRGPRCPVAGRSSGSDTSRRRWLGDSTRPAR